MGRIRWILNRCTYYCHHKQQTLFFTEDMRLRLLRQKDSCVGSGRNREGRHHWLFGVLSSSKGIMTLLHITIACYCAAFRTPVSCYSLDQTATQPIDSTWEFDCQHISQSVQVMWYDLGSTRFMILLLRDIMWHQSFPFHKAIQITSRALLSSCGHGLGEPALWWKQTQPLGNVLVILTNHVYCVACVRVWLVILYNYTMFYCSVFFSAYIIYIGFTQAMRVRNMSRNRFPLRKKLLKLLKVIFFLLDWEARIAHLPAHLIARKARRSRRVERGEAQICLLDGAMNMGDSEAKQLWNEQMSITLESVHVCSAHSWSCSTE